MRSKIIRLKLICQECHSVGWLEFSKKDLKKLLEFIKTKLGTKSGDWTRIDKVSTT